MNNITNKKEINSMTEENNLGFVEKIKKKTVKEESEWEITGDLSAKEKEEAIKLLNKGVPVRKVAVRFKILVTNIRKIK